MTERDVWVKRYRGRVLVGSVVATIAVGAAVVGSKPWLNPDNSPPVIRVSSPAPNGALQGTQTLSATCNDSTGASAVQFKMDGSAIGDPVTDLSPDANTDTVFSFDWPSTDALDGTHSLTAVCSDAAGNMTTSLSRTVYVTNTTGNVWVDARGSDAGDGCVRHSSAVTNPDVLGTSLCRSWQQAYQLAEVGDTVRVAGGTYEAQTFPRTIFKADDAGVHCDWAVNDPTFVPISAEPSSDYSGCITFAPAGAVTVAFPGVNVLVDYVRIQQMTITNSLALGGNPGQNGVTCDLIHAHDNIALNNRINGTFYLSSDHSALIGNDVQYGTSNNGEQTAHIRDCRTPDTEISTQRVYEGLIDNTFANFIQETNETHPHMEAIHGEGGDHVLVRGNTFFNNAGHNLSMQCQLGQACSDFRVENNFFDQICSHQVTTANGGTCTIQGGDGFSCGGNNLTNAGAYFNSYYNGSPEFLFTASTPGSGGCTIGGILQSIGNVAISRNQFGCDLITGDGVLFEHNLWYGSGVQCGSTNTIGNPLFVDASTGNLHVMDGSDAINLVPTNVTGGCPATDIDGTARPIDVNCTAGADEHG